MEPAPKRRKTIDIRNYFSGGRTRSEKIAERYRDPWYFGTEESRHIDNKIMDDEEFDAYVRFDAFVYDVRDLLGDILVKRMRCLRGSAIELDPTTVLRDIAYHDNVIELHTQDASGPSTHAVSPFELLSERYFPFHGIWDALEARMRRITALLLALHPRVGRNSPLYRFSQQVLFDPNLIRAIYQVL